MDAGRRLLVDVKFLPFRRVLESDDYYVPRDPATIPVRRVDLKDVEVEAGQRSWIRQNGVGGPLELILYFPDGSYAAELPAELAAPLSSWLTDAALALDRLVGEDLDLRTEMR